jgi:hypothetical protein
MVPISEISVEGFMNKEELLEALEFKNELFPSFIMKIKDANNDVFEIYKFAFVPSNIVVPSNRKFG